MVGFLNLTDLVMHNSINNKKNVFNYDEVFLEDESRYTDFCQHCYSYS